MYPGNMHQYYSSKSIIILGFSAVFTLFVALMAVWVSTVTGNQQHLRSVVLEHGANELLFAMRDAALQRAMILHRMALVEDIFERDELYMRFHYEASKFIAARDELLAMELTGDQSRIWFEEAQPVVRVNYVAQAEIADMMMLGEITAANKKLIDEVLPRQNLVLGKLTEMLERNRAEVQRELVEAASFNNTAFFLVTLLGSITLLLGGITAWFVIRKTSVIERGLQDAREAEAHANEMKSQFLANMSHEIRTPLTAIVGFAKSLRDDPKLDSSHSAALDTIVNNSEHLARIIDDILDLSKIESNKIEIERIRFPLFPLIKDIEALMQTPAGDAGLVFNVVYEFPLPEQIETDPTRLKQILLNLCANAIKFTDEGDVSLRITYLSNTKQLQFSVIDTGIGISIENQERIFAPFVQADASTTRRFGGTGLGLYVSKQLTERLGGEMTIQSVEHVGTRIDLRMPVGDISTSALVSTPSLTADNIEFLDKPVTIPKLRGHILLAEDSPDIQKLVSLYINKTGADISLTSNGKEAIEKVKAGVPFDLILMDVQMPIMDGLQATGMLRKMGYEGPIIALTANAMKEDREHCLQAGCTEFLSKPINQRHFYKILGRYLYADSYRIPTKSQLIPPAVDPRLQDLVDQFVAGLSERMSAITDAFDRQDWEALRTFVHQLKGLAGSMGFPHLTDKAAEMEKLLVTKRHDRIAPMLGELQSMINDVLQSYPARKQS